MKYSPLTKGRAERQDLCRFANLAQRFSRTAFSHATLFS
jgi:hypothetical protein